MIFLKVLAVVLGLAFLLFGYFIYFKKKYNLINGFEADFKAGRKKEEYAKKVGMIEFVVGIVLLITGVALILFVYDFSTTSSCIFCITFPDLKGYGLYLSTVLMYESYQYLHIFHYFVPDFQFFCIFHQSG